MEKPSGKVGSGRQKRLLTIGALLVVGFVVVAASAWMLAPRLTEHLLTQQLERVEQRAGLTIEAGVLRTRGLDGLSLRDVTISVPGADRQLGRIDSLEASISLWQAARGRPAVSAVYIDGLHVTLHRRSDGSSDVDDILASLRGDGDDIAVEELDVTGDEDPISAFVQRLLRHFGGRYPDVSIERIVVELTHDEPADPWIVDRITSDVFWIDGHEENAPFGTDLELHSQGSERWSLPDSISIAGTLRLPADESTVTVDFDPALRVTDLSRLPFAELSLSGLAIDDDYALELQAPTLASTLREESQHLASADRVRAEFNRWSLAPSKMHVVTLEVDSPRLDIEYSFSGASNMGEFYALLRRPAPRAVIETAQRTTETIASVGDDANTDDDSSSDSGDDEATPPKTLDRLLAQIASFPVEEWLTDRLPRKTTFRDVQIVVDDARLHDTLTRPAHHLELAGELLELRHSPLNGLLEGYLQFRTTAGDQRGSADIEFKIPYRDGDWNAAVDVDGLELSHLAQLAGPQVAHHLQGGQLSATLDIDNQDNGELTTFDGLVAGRELKLSLGAIAEDPIEIASTSLRFDGFYNPSMAIPEARLIDLEDDEDDDGDSPDEALAPDLEEDAQPEDDVDSPPDQGGFVVREAVARLEDLEASMGFSVYGLDGARRPNRLDLQVGLEPTPLQTIIDAVPTAIRGALDGTQMQGDLEWDFDLEVPLYQASQMRWDASVRLSPDFEVIYLPEDVDVFKLTEEFEHTIEDEWKATIAHREREITYERTITIPAMKPTPADWLLENTSMDLERIDAMRRQRDWPPIPHWNPSLDVSPDVLEEPEFWLTDTALQTAAARPWEDVQSEDRSWWDGFRLPGIGRQSDGTPSATVDDDRPQPVEKILYKEPDPPDYHKTDVSIDPDRHGTYVYVPLHHISPYMIRAIMTTEDTSFFRHSGFNYLAIRQSVEANLEAGRYVRGASTISMQLAKNLFLDRQRVLSRKLQEVALVWLMESVADVPKERLMELYLNIIEFGPGIYGIHEASVYYFGKRPDELTIAEVAWLVSIVPSPKRYHRYYDRGSIPPYWFRRMSRYIRAMYWRDRISEQERDDAMEGDPPPFYIPEEGDPLLAKEAQERAEPDTSIEGDAQDSEVPLF